MLATQPTQTERIVPPCDPALSQVADLKVAVSRIAARQDIDEMTQRRHTALLESILDQQLRILVMLTNPRTMLTIDYPIEETEADLDK